MTSRLMRRTVFFSSRRRHTRCVLVTSTDVCSSDLLDAGRAGPLAAAQPRRPRPPQRKARPTERADDRPKDRGLSGPGETPAVRPGGTRQNSRRFTRLLFGQAEPGGVSRPALADETLDLLVIHAPETLPDALQRRLAAALGDGVFHFPGPRRQF